MSGAMLFFLVCVVVSVFLILSSTNDERRK
jgi:hypothetical protein